MNKNYICSGRHGLSTSTSAQDSPVLALDAHAGMQAKSIVPSREPSATVAASHAAKESLAAAGDANARDVGYAVTWQVEDVMDHHDRDEILVLEAQTAALQIVPRRCGGAGAERFLPFLSTCTSTLISRRPPLCMRGFASRGCCALLQLLFIIKVDCLQQSIYAPKEAPITKLGFCCRGRLIARKFACSIYTFAWLVTNLNLQEYSSVLVQEKPRRYFRVTPQGVIFGSSQSTYS